MDGKSVVEAVTREQQARDLLTPVLAWIDEAASDPLLRLQRIDAAYMQLAELIKALGANGRRGDAARQLVHEVGLDQAAALSGYSKATMQRVAWQ